MHDAPGAARRSRALLLVAHGSQRSADSSRPVHEHADRVRRSGLFDEVREAFWKEEPYLRDALDLVESDDVFVVPFFLADGYYTRQVVPRELGLRIGTAPAAVRAGGRRVFYCPPVGSDPRLEELILRRAVDACGASGAHPRDAALLVIGHGTELSATSGGTTREMTIRLAGRGLFGAVECGFLDEEPRIQDVVARQAAATVVLVPFFVAEGWHTRTTIPQDLALDGERTERDGRVLWYTPPVGIFPEVAEVIADIALRAARDAAAA